MAQRKFKISKTKRLAVCLRSEFHCLYCNRNLHGANPENITMEHLDPQSKGGSDDLSNLFLACAKCNRERGNMPWRKYAKNGRTIRRVLKLRKTNIDPFYKLAATLIQEKNNGH